MRPEILAIQDRLTAYDANPLYPDYAFKPADVRILLAEIEMLESRIAELESLTRSQADRIAAQSELLSRRAENATFTHPDENAD